jgi:NADPH:quinone reductase-like Zn-dependent oxidoreductase
MPRKHPTQHNATCTPEQYAASQEAAAVEGVPLAEFIRRAVKRRCAAQGINYPDNLVRRGKYRGKANRD